METFQRFSSRDIVNKYASHGISVVKRTETLELLLSDSIPQLKLNLLSILKSDLLRLEIDPDRRLDTLIEGTLTVSFDNGSFTDTDVTKHDYFGFSLIK